ncbi:MAG: signal peptidase I [Chloroflexota bacterium]|nr:signal peptidase I [Chloroflexota bacterium]
MSAAEPAKSGGKRKSSLAKELLETVILTVAIFLVVRVALQNFKVEGMSMVPNLHNNEYILVNKVDYHIQSPQRGDVIVFQAVPAGQPNKDFIKRVIALPGETVAVHNHQVFINGRALREPYIAQAPDYVFSPRRVPKNSYFVLGDNRNDSYDSSKWPVTWLPSADIIGKAWVAYWPPSDLSIFHDPSYHQPK